jgi:hypothetical protein
MPNSKGSHLAAALCRQALWRRTPSPHRARRSSVDLNEDRVEATHALKAGPGGDLSHGKSGGIEQSLGPLHARGLGHLHRTGAEMLMEEPAQVPRADAKAIGEAVDAAVMIERTLGDEAQGSLDGCA